ncbi:MAG: hypothetical protein SPJ79_09960 [Prevotella sp.]|nr:hypothetical protein [Bacteroidales bacterium]MDY5877888.1 hypothetical protein [Prevotella sp.]
MFLAIASCIAISSALGIPLVAHPKYYPTAIIKHKSDMLKIPMKWAKNDCLAQEVMPVFRCRSYLVLHAPVIDVGEETETEGVMGSASRMTLGILHIRGLPG